MTIEKLGVTVKLDRADVAWLDALVRRAEQVAPVGDSRLGRSTVMRQVLRTARVLTATGIVRCRLLGLQVHLGNLGKPATKERTRKTTNDYEQAINKS